MSGTEVSVRADEFGVVTMASTADAMIRACALAASLRIHEPKVPIGLLVPRRLRVHERFFDFVQWFDEPEPFAGELRYLNKLVQPFALSPFERTLFMDDDTLIIRPIRTTIDRAFRGHALAINCRVDDRSTPRHGMNHLVPEAVCETFGLNRCYNTNGGGHMYFERASRERVSEVAELAISYGADDAGRYERLAGQKVVSDEIALLLAANHLRLHMPVLPDFVDALTLKQASKIDLDVADSHYEWSERSWGVLVSDVRVVHFASSAKRSLPYSREIRRLTGLRQSFDRGLAGFRRRAAHRYLRFFS